MSLRKCLDMNKNCYFKLLRTQRNWFCDRKRLAKRRNTGRISSDKSRFMRKSSPIGRYGFDSLRLYHNAHIRTRLKWRISGAFMGWRLCKATCLTASSAPKIIHRCAHFRSENFKVINFWWLQGKNVGNTGSISEAFNEVDAEIYTSKSGSYAFVMV